MQNFMQGKELIARLQMAIGGIHPSNPFLHVEWEFK